MDPRSVCFGGLIRGFAMHPIAQSSLKARVSTSTSGGSVRVVPSHLFALAGAGSYPGRGSHSFCARTGMTDTRQQYDGKAAVLRKVWRPMPS